MDPISRVEIRLATLFSKWELTSLRAFLRQELSVGEVSFVL